MVFQGIIRNLAAKDIASVESIYDLYWHDDFRLNLSRRLHGYANSDPEIVSQKFSYIVAEENSEVVGVLGMRNLPESMRPFANTERPCELYILAVRNVGGGVGTALVEKMKEMAYESGYAEIVLYSGESHSEFWGFYDHIGFERAGEMIAPNGEKGMAWRMVL